MSQGTGAATQAELRLIARLCAEKLLRETEKAAGPEAMTCAILNSVLREPSPFLRAYDLLLGAGWDPVREGAAYGRALAQEMKRALEEFHLATQAGLHRRLRREAPLQKPLLAPVLIVGFNAAHWPLWDLLGAVVSCAEESVSALSAPRTFGMEIDQLWAGSWEEITGTSSEIPEGAIIENERNIFAGVVASYERGNPGSAVEADLTFLVTPGLISQARAVVLQTLDYLKHDSCTRLGIVFPEANALALGVAEELRRLGIPLDDGTGSIRPGLFERRCWQSWIALQEEASVQGLVAWLRACEAQGVSCGLETQLSARAVADVLENALGESLVDDLDFLARHLDENSTARFAPAVADFLRRRIVLPEAASFSEFLATTRRAMAMPGWEDYLARLPADPPAWLKTGCKLSRRIFLEWLKESTNSREQTRGAEGNHFYGKVHLLIYAQNDWARISESSHPDGPE